MVKKPPVNSSEEWNSKRPPDDTVSTISSLHSSPTVSPQGSPRKGLSETHYLCKNSLLRCYLINLLWSFFPVGGVAKSQNSNQLNLSGSSSSLTSDASTKAVSLRSYGIGGALLHKRIQAITRQHSRERPRVLEEEEEDGEKGSKMENEMQESRGRSRQQSCQSRQVDLKAPSFRPGKKDPITPTGRAPTQPGLGAITPPLPPLSQHQKPSESPFRSRLMSPFKILRERSRSRKRPEAVRPRFHAGEMKAEAPPSSKQEKQEEERARRSLSPNPFLWLCRVRHVRSKTL